MAADPLRVSGVRYWPYDPRLRFELPLIQAPESTRITPTTGVDEQTVALRVGWVEAPPPIASRLDGWWLEQYGRWTVHAAA
jgi:uncharacterized protein